jgi:PQQ-like domain
MGYLPGPQAHCASPGEGSTSSISASAQGDWPTYHHDNARTGVAAGLAPLGCLSRAWQARLDGAVYGQPLLVGDRVFAATENDTVYALQAASGQVVWSSHIATPMPLADLPCGNIDPLGVTSTMVYDPATHLVFALAETKGARTSWSASMLPRERSGKASRWSRRTARRSHISSGAR